MIIGRLVQKFRLDVRARARIHMRTRYGGLKSLHFSFHRKLNLALGRDTWRAAVHTVMYLSILYNSGNILTSCATISFSKSTVLYGIGWLVVFWLLG
jgi:hypothetical protein